MASGTQQRAHEVRLGLVMYGGVSLAVYINGVAHELFRAVRGRGVYRLLKELTDSDVAVDVVSGTSAGGVNGILLGFALCNEREFAPAAEIWREGADIGALLRRPDGESTDSLLDGEGFYQTRLEDVFARIWATPAESGDAPSPVHELDLFITGTDYNGRLGTTLDEAGHAVDVKDHRALFWLKHRRGRKEQLDPRAGPSGRLPSADEGAAAPQAGFEALARLARITSCFPAAFAPVLVPSRGDGESAAFARLRTWGKLDDDRAYCFLDGGVLDNKPFTSTLRAIFYRTSERPVRRHLLYVEPDPERWSHDNARFKVPSFAESALDSLTKLPAYESIADDLRLVTEHNDKIERLEQLREALLGRRDEPSQAQRELWRRARLSALRDRVLRRLFGVENGERLDEALAHRFRELRDHFERAYALDATLSQRLLFDFDLEFRLRRLFHLSYLCADERALLAINRQIELLEIVRHAMDDALARGAETAADATPAEVWQRAFQRLSALLRLDESGKPFPRSRSERDASRALTPAELETARLELARRLERKAAEPASEGEQFFGASDRYELACIDAFGGPVREAYLGYEALDAWLFPLEFVADLHERDVIRVTRLSPIDARRGLCDRKLDEKLCGDALAHFGAFFKRSWRSNDILWGRLDGVCQLVETLGERDFVAQSLASSRRKPPFGCERTQTPEARRAAVLTWLETHAVFPHAGDGLRRALADMLASLLDVAYAGARSESETEAALAAHLRTAWAPLIDDLVRAAHLDILDEELPRVVQDAAFEQMQWNQLATRNGGDETDDARAAASVAFVARTLSFESNRNHFEPLLLALASRELALRALERLRQADDPSALENYFRSYRVGSETLLEHVPRVVLLELAGRAALVTKDCVVDSFPEPETVRGHGLYRVFLDWPLRVFDATARFLRYAPGWRRPFVVAALAYGALALVVNALWFGTLYAEDGPERTLALLLFVVAPVACVVYAWLLVRPFRSSERGLRYGWLLELGVILLTLLATSALLDSDFTPLCASAPLLELGEHCAPVLRALVLLLPLTVGLLLGVFRRIAASSPRARRASARARAKHGRLP